MWTLNKICQAVIGVLKFVKLEVEKVDSTKIDELLDEVRALYASIARRAQISFNDRPSLCERRERGEALALLDIVKVCQCQYWRYRTLVNCRNKGNLGAGENSALEAMIKKEVERLAVIFTLLKYPARKAEMQRCRFEKVGETWRLKLPAMERKKGRYPIDVRLSK